MLLKEILQMQAQPFKWLDRNRAIFELLGKEFGIYVTFVPITFRDGSQIEAVNISFGIIKNNKFDSDKDMDLSLSRMEKPRTVLSTVAEACIVNKEIVACDVICLASNDSVKHKRTLLYSLALAEIRHMVQEFKSANDIIVETDYGAFLVLLSKKKFSDSQEKELAKRLHLKK